VTSKQNQGVQMPAHSKVSIHSSESARRDPLAKSIGYFSQNQLVKIDAALIDEIRDMALETRENVRLSLHNGPDAAFHEMIIFQHRDKYYRPKKHVGKAKSFHMIEGEMAVFAFDETGNVLDACKLGGNSGFLYRVEANVFHTDIPLTDYVIHHESTLGPFLGEDDRVYGPWSPDGTSKEDYLAYRDQLVASLP